MGVPKRKQSRSRRDSRSANKFITPQIAAICKQDNCNAAILPHIVCSTCGYYKGKKILTVKAKTAKNTVSENN